MDLKQDNSESKQVMEDLRAQNQFLRTILDSFVYPFYVINAETYIVEMANAPAYNGHLKGDLTCYTLIHRKDKPCSGEAHPCTLREITRTKKPTIVEHVHLDQDGSPRNVEVHGFPIFDQQG
ncbi:MAG: diguanylate cyclase, partial [Gammaproteobacteria bacterium]|nr:diguanylate cyclase [Gammaproteobacteria bacterium]